MAKHACKHCGLPRSGHNCTVAKRFIAKHDDEFVIIAAAVMLSTPEAEIARLFPADPAPKAEEAQQSLDFDTERFVGRASVYEGGSDGE